VLSLKMIKRQAKTNPDYKGKVNVNGKDMEVALWLKESKSGMKYFSTTFQEPYVKPEAAVVTDEQDDDLPF
jgi:uncharacterized protein (DUF736 family)